MSTSVFPLNGSSSSSSSTYSSNTTSSNWTAGHHQRVAPPEGCLELGADTGGFIPWDNPDNVISQETEHRVDTAVGTICLPILFLISAPTNVLNMMVFWKQGVKDRINLCLFYLSFVDFFHMFHAFVCSLDRFYLPFNSGVLSGPVFQFIVRYRLLGLRSVTWLSGSISMLIACERCFCVVSPLHSQNYFTVRTTGIVLVFLTAFCLTGSLLNGMRWSLVCVFDPVTNSASKALRTSPFYVRHRSDMNILTLFYATVQPFTYVTVIMATTIVTSVKLKAMMAWREETSSRVLSTREMTLTRMLIASSVLYIMCSVPTSILGVCLLFVPNISLNGRHHNLGLFIVSFFQLASYINATFNFFVYVSLGSKYRNTLRTLFHWFGFKRISSDSNKKKGMV